MDIKTVNIKDIKPYPNNPRKNDSAVDAVVESIKQCGYCSPIVVDEDMVVLAGHTRLKAIKRLGWTECEVCVQEGRNFIGIELGDQYFETATKRIQEAEEELLNDF